MKVMFKKIVVFSLVIFFLPSQVLAVVSNDPDVSQWSYTDTKVFEAWDKVTGSKDVIVAIIDNGFDAFHPDIFPNVWKNEGEIPDNNIDDDNNGYIDDVWGWDFSGNDINGDGVFTGDELQGDNEPRPEVAGENPAVRDEIHHGTLVAGIIGAVGNNNKLGAGINWNVRLMNLKVIQRGGVGDLYPVIGAIRYAADNGADVINISLVGDVDIEVKKAIKYAYDKGVAIVAAAGNSRVALNISKVYPVCADSGEAENWILGVSAIQENHVIAPFSNTGSSCVDLTAPGVNINSTMRYSPRYGFNDQYGGPWQGTSFAAPFVAGTAALIKSIQPSWSPKQIYQAILTTVHRTPPTDVAEYENLYGAGLLQIDKAVEFALAQKQTSQPVDYFGVADLSTGRLVQYVNLQNEEVGLESALKKVDDVVAFKNGYVTFRHISKSVAEMVIYDNNWKITNHWTVPALGSMQIAIGDTDDSPGLEVVLSPQYKDSLVYRVYSFEGKKIREFRDKSFHSGVSIGLNKVGGADSQIVALYNGDLVSFGKNNTIVDKFNVSTSPKVAGSFAVGDIDGDGVQDFVVSMGNSLTYLKQDGTLMRKFIAYDGLAQTSFELGVGDYDNDGKDDVITVPKFGEGKVRVWDSRSRKLDQWDSVGTNLHVVVKYK